MSTQLRPCPHWLRPEGPCCGRPSTLNQPFALALSPMPPYSLSSAPPPTPVIPSGGPGTSITCLRKCACRSHASNAAARDPAPLRMPPQHAVSPAPVILSTPPAPSAPFNRAETMRRHCSTGFQPVPVIDSPSGRGGAFPVPPLLPAALSRRAIRSPTHRLGNASPSHSCAQRLGTASPSAPVPPPPAVPGAIQSKLAPCAT